MNIQVQPVIAGAALPCLLFKAGQFVRIKNSEVVGRVIEDTSDEYSNTRVHIFDDSDSSWGTNPSFGPGCLKMWAPEIVVECQPVVTPPMDLGKAYDLLRRILAAFELTEDLGKREIASGNDSLLANHLELIGDTFSDTTMELLDMVFREQYRQEKKEGN
jgi:hypothetical protein